MGILVTNIQRFSLHDGPGIRTTVFLKGCSLCCPWCSNPENLSPHPEKYIKDGIEGTYGKYYTPDELYAEIIKDKAFYSGDILPEDWKKIDSSKLDRLPGGVTFSGGEALLQARQLEPLWKRLNEERIHTAVETCLFVLENILALAIKYIDLFYVDVKILDNSSCREDLRGDLELYLSNFEKLLSSGKPIVIRVPVIGGYTDGEDNRKQVRELLCGKNILKIELIKEHNLGLPKYESLIKAGSAVLIPTYVGVSDELMEEYKGELSDLGIPVEVCKI